MKKVLASLCLLLGASSAFAQTSNTVRWQGFAGVITAQNVDNLSVQTSTVAPLPGPCVAVVRASIWARELRLSTFNSWSLMEPSSAVRQSRRYSADSGRA
jgi:hypothetical protein